MPNLKEHINTSTSHTMQYLSFNYFFEHITLYSLVTVQLMISHSMSKTTQYKCPALEIVPPQP